MVTVAMDTVVTGLAISQCPSTPVAQGASDRVVSVSTIFCQIVLRLMSKESTYWVSGQASARAKIYLTHKIVGILSFLGRIHDLLLLSKSNSFTNLEFLCNTLI